MNMITTVKISFYDLSTYNYYNEEKKNEKIFMLARLKLYAVEFLKKKKIVKNKKRTQRIGSSSLQNIFGIQGPLLILIQISTIRELVGKNKIILKKWRNIEE